MSPERLPRSPVAPPVDAALDELSLGPVRIDRDAAPELLGIRVTDLGNPGLGGGDGGAYELVLLPPPGEGVGRAIWKKKVSGETHVEAGCWIWTTTGATRSSCATVAPT